jgi:hypothetical protein
MSSLPRRLVPAVAVTLCLSTAAAPRVLAQVPQVPPGQQLPTPDQARDALQNQPELVERLRQRLLESGLTPDQVRARLRAAGYPETLLDEYLMGADTTRMVRPGPRTLDLGRFGSAGVQICYEIIFSGNVVDAANRPDFIFNPSNDAWFGAWGPPQHLAQARLRAIEEGLPVLRATPTGVSAVIDAEGRLLQSLPWREAGAIDARLPAPKPPTLFARFGNALVLLFALLFVGAAIAVRREAR